MRACSTIEADPERRLRSPAALSAQNRCDKLELERGAAAKKETKIDETAKRIVTMTVTVRPVYEKSPASLSPVERLK